MQDQICSWVPGVADQPVSYGHPDDSRAVQLTLTSQGREVTALATERVLGLQDELTAPLGGLDSPATQTLIASLHTLLGSTPPRVLGEDELTAQVIRGLQVGDDAVHAAAADLASHDLIRRESSPQGTQVALTDAGAARFDQIQAGISEVSVRLYGGLPEADLATAHRVLATVTERAHAELAG